MHPEVQSKLHCGEHFTPSLLHLRRVGGAAAISTIGAVRAVFDLWKLGNVPLRSDSWWSRVLLVRGLLFPAFAKATAA